MTIRYLPVILLLLAVTIAPLVGHAASELDQIAQIYIDGDTAKALSRLDTYVEKHPKDSLPWTIKGNILEELDRDDEAERAYLAALKANEKAFEAICSLGILRRKSGDYDGAIGYYQKALKINPGYAQAYSSMAVIELKRGRNDEAVRLAQLGYDKDRRDPILAANLALACHYANKIPEREKYTRIAKKLGYKKMDALAKFYSGELSVRD